ncbi:MAG: hypothetical protein R2752_13860 [Vicinamibacterales bacterium]
MRQSLFAAALLAVAVPAIAAAQVPTTPVTPAAPPSALLVRPPAGPATPAPVRAGQAVSTRPPSATAAVPAAPPQPRAQQTPRAVRRNVKLDLAITDTYGGTPTTKTVTVLIASGENGMIRTANRLTNGMGVELNVDATAQIQPVAGPNGVESIWVRVTFEYTPAQGENQNGTSTNPMTGAMQPQHPAQLHESLTVVLEDGTPLLVSQSADPATERQVKVELTATIQR